MKREASEILIEMSPEEFASTFNSEAEDGEIFQLASILVRLGEGKVPTIVETTEDTFLEEDEQREERFFDSKDGSGPSKKRQRTSPEQLDILEKIFRTDQMPSHQTRLELADKLGMSARRVQIWFQNKRAKLKRINKDGVTKSPSSPSSPPQDPLLSPKDKQKSPKAQVIPSLPFINFSNGVTPTNLNQIFPFSAETTHHFNFQPLITKHLSEPKPSYRLSSYMKEDGRMTLPQMNSGLVIGMS